jgi:hypothetical protein
MAVRFQQALAAATGMSSRPQLFALEDFGWPKKLCEFPREPTRPWAAVVVNGKNAGRVCVGTNCLRWNQYIVHGGIDDYSVVST